MHAANSKLRQFFCRAVRGGLALVLACLRAGAQEHVDKTTEALKGGSAGVCGTPTEGRTEVLRHTEVETDAWERTTTLDLFLSEFGKAR